MSGVSEAHNEHSGQSAVVLNIRRELLPEPELERWLREHVVARIPGSDHAD